VRGRAESQAFRLSRSGSRRKRILGVVTKPADRLGFRRSSQTTSYAFVAEPETNGCIERLFRTLKEQAIHGYIF